MGLGGGGIWRGRGWGGVGEGVVRDPAQCSF